MITIFKYFSLLNLIMSQSGAKKADLDKFYPNATGGGDKINLQEDGVILENLSLIEFSTSEDDNILDAEISLDDQVLNSLTYINTRDYSADGSFLSIEHKTKSAKSVSFLFIYLFKDFFICS